MCREQILRQRGADGAKREGERGGVHAWQQPCEHPDERAEQKEHGKRTSTALTGRSIRPERRLANAVAPISAPLRSMPSAVEYTVTIGVPLLGAGHEGRSALRRRRRPCPPDCVAPAASCSSS